jgi:hypothetical protein
MQTKSLLVCKDNWQHVTAPFFIFINFFFAKKENKSLSTVTMGYYQTTFAAFLRISTAVMRIAKLRQRFVPLFMTHRFASPLSTQRHEWEFSAQPDYANVGIGLQTSFSPLSYLCGQDATVNVCNLDLS